MHKLAYHASRPKLTNVVVIYDTCIDSIHCFLSTRADAQLFKTVPVAWKTWTCSSPSPNDTQETSKWCDLRDRTAERNAETLARVRRISPEAGGLPDEIYLEMWLVWEKEVLGKKVWVN
jgi:hypothetical protein